MPRIVEQLLPLSEGPPQLDERQITPGQLVDMRLGYLSNLGAEVEMVTTETGRVRPITIAAVGRSFLLGEKPEGDRLVTQDEMNARPIWVKCDYVTFYTVSREGDAVRYDYDHFGYQYLNLGPVRNNNGQPLGWHPNPLWYLRWPADTAAKTG